jgi:hypothetical protein
MNNDPAAMAGLMKSFGFTYGLIIMFSAIINSLFYPLFLLVLFLDLKIRKNDFPQRIVNDDIAVIGELPIE